MRPPFAVLVLLSATGWGASGTKLARERRRNQDVPATTPQPTLEATSAPTGPCLYYTNYVSGCTNDCGQEPTQATYETIDECCINHHNYEGAGGYVECMNITAVPTLAPTSYAPTVPVTIAPTAPCPHYNSWDGTCVNDCQEPLVPRWFDSLDECCLSEYTWDGAYETCMGICLFYNNWEGTCVADCQHDLRLDLTYLTVEECCDGQYTWAGAYDSCMKLALPGMNLTAAPTYIPTAAPSGIPTTPQPTAPCPYYSNFVSGCVNDCMQKGYEPIYETLEACCTYHHDWIDAPGDYEDCIAEGMESLRDRLGLTKSPTYIPTRQPSDPPTSLSPTAACLYYTNYNTQCVNDCMQKGYEPMHDSLVACCIFHHDWIEAPGDYSDCIAGGMESERDRLGLTKSPTYIPTRQPSDPPTSLAPTGPCPFYSNFITGCVNDCEQQGYEPLYGTLDECCFAHHGWIPETPGDWMDCMGLTESPTLKPTFRPTPVPTLEPVSSCMFYSDYATGCKNDCLESGDEPLYETLKDCCSFHHNYIGAQGDYLECMGLTLPPTVKPTDRPTPAPTPEPVSSCMFYSDYVTGCKNDCLENGDEPLYETLIDCCDQHHYWFGPGGYEDCSGIPFPIPVAPPPPPVPPPAEVASSSISLHNKKGLLDDDPPKVEDTQGGNNPAPPPTMSTSTTELFHVHKKMDRDDDDRRNLRTTKRKD